jgi:hypothetical protein
MSTFGYAGGVISYSVMGYWDPFIQMKEGDVLAIFRFQSQEVVVPFEVSAAPVGESSTTACPVRWPSLLPLERRVEGVPYRKDFFHLSGKGLKKTREGISQVLRERLDMTAFVCVFSARSGSHRSDQPGCRRPETQVNRVRPRKAPIFKK